MVSSPQARFRARAIEMNLINTAALSLFLLGSSFMAVNVQAKCDDPRIMRGNLLVNGSFEDPAIEPPNAHRTHEVPTQSIPGWLLAGKPGTTLADVEAIKCPEAGNPNNVFGADAPNYCPAADQNQYLDLGRPSRGAIISQSVRTNKDALYNLRLCVAATKPPGLTGPIPGIHVELRDDNGTRLVDKMVGGVKSGKSPGLDWQEASYYFRASTAGVTITISDEHASANYESFIDKVVLVGVQSERTQTQLWMGFIMLGFFGLLLWYSIHRVRLRRT